MKQYDVLIVCGGTGGHIYPALAVGEELRDRTARRARVLFVVKRGGFEEKVMREAGFDVCGIRAAGFSRTELSRNIRLLWILPLGFLSAFGLVKRSGVKVVFSTGGYAGVPVLAAAVLLKKPVYLQEQNSFPGVTVRFFTRFARRIFLAYKEAEAFLPAGRVYMETGNPLRRVTGKNERDLRAEFGVPSSAHVIFVVGGSQGAHAINRVVAASIDVLTAGGRCFLMWQTGKTDFNRVTTEVGGRPFVRLFDFIPDIYDFYRTADLCVCRAGAMTISELSLFGTPAVFIPLPGAAGDHQTRNARNVEQRGAALCVTQERSSTELVPAVRGLLDNPDRLRVMRAHMKALYREDAAAVVAAALQQEAGL